MESLTSCREMVELCPIATVTDLDRGPVHSVEIHIVLAHELVQSDVFWVEPPLFPLSRHIVRGDARVTNGGIELRHRSAYQTRRERQN